jgi:hypothetical protein
VVSVVVLPFTRPAESAPRPALRPIASAVVRRPTPRQARQSVPSLADDTERRTAVREGLDQSGLRATRGPGAMSSGPAHRQGRRLQFAGAQFRTPISSPRQPMDHPTIRGSACPVVDHVRCQVPKTHPATCQRKVRDRSGKHLGTARTSHAHRTEPLVSQKQTVGSYPHGVGSAKGCAQMLIATTAAIDRMRIVWLYRIAKACRRDIDFLLVKRLVH